MHNSVVNKLQPRHAALALGLVAIVLSASGTAVGQEPPTLAQESVAPSLDHATSVRGDPLDYSQATDLLTDGNGPTLNVSDVKVGAGQATWRASDNGYVSPIAMTIPGALPDASDGVAQPIDAETFTHLGMRLWSSARVPGGIQWFVCNDYSAACFRFHNFTFEQGWNLYDIDLRAVSGDWRGELLGIRLANGFATDLRLDWLRLHDGGEDVAIQGSGPFTFDSTVSASDNGVDGPAHGRLAGSVLPTGALAPGSYVVRDAGGTASAPIVVRDAPRPVVLDPDVTGGEDWAAAVRGDAWDFSQASDHGQVVGTRDVAVNGGVFSGTNATNDPSVALTLAGPIDTTRFHRLTVRSSYDGPFNLGFDAGGGSHARVVFRHADQPNASVSSKELVTYSDRPSATWDLTDNRVGAAVEDRARAWNAAPVSFLRWDPNEDPGARRWRLDDVRLAADDEANGVFPVQWQDDAHSGATTVTIGIDKDRSGYDGPTTTFTGRGGIETGIVVTDDALPRRSWIWVQIDDGTDVSRSYASGPLQLTGRLAGGDRIATGLVLSRVHFDTSDVAVVASSVGFADALAGTALAAAVDAPILLNGQAGLDDRVAAEIRRLGADEVLLLGGTSAQSAAVQTGLEALGVRVERLAGRDRYETAVSIATEARARWSDGGVAPSDDVILASGTTFPDALAAGPLAATTRSPILLTPPDRLAPVVATALDDFGATRVVAIGGTVALSERATSSTGRPVDRVAGMDRYATAVMVAERASAAGANSADVLLASGANFPDALAAGAAAVRRGGVLLLTPPNMRSEAVERVLASADRVRVVGGRVAVADHVVAGALAAVR